ncbi:hypothetical protein O1611_g808 [Lasiodiplodia mahajangana]|uniref:Uncharacterized protein n=1 Tax=Lasiodiplodia mahajangana TaxID=1108764 RepID=A0ACC2JZ69_9PEZI|nr:hypothetical protein O1611_g808 [Lasiodiplodia mahajangana]
MYTSLNPARREIRLLQIVDETDSGVIECVFHTVSLEDDIEFAALSYVWGNPDTTQEILLNGYRRGITKNLESALRNFRSNFTANGFNLIRRFNLLEDFIQNERDLSSLKHALSSKRDWDLHHESDSEHEHEAKRVKTTSQSIDGPRAHNSFSVQHGDDDDSDDRDAHCGDKKAPLTHRRGKDIYTTPHLRDTDSTDNSNRIVHDSGVNDDQYDTEDDDGGYGDDEDTSGDDNFRSSEEDTNSCSGKSEREADSNAYPQSMIERIICAYDHAKVGGGGLPIWIDALCINQDDLSEKSHQIQLMGDIYKRAHRVFSWLGQPDDKKIDFALKTIRRITPCLHPGRESEMNLMRHHPELFNWRVAGSITSNPYWNAILNFQKSENFKRLWIFQELLASKDPTFICGDEYLPMSYLRQYMRWGASIPNFPREKPRYPTNDQGVWDILRLKLPRFGVLFNLLLAGKSCEEPVDKTYLFIDIVRRWHCKDPRDKVFALLGVFPMTNPPDYNKSVVDVYMDWATDPLWDVPPDFLLRHSGIGLYPRTLTDGEFPSWMPQLDIIGQQIQAWDIIWEKPSAISRTPACFRPAVSRATGITCYGVQVTEVSEIITRPSKTASDYDFPGGQLIAENEPREAPVIENGHGILAPILKYLISNREQLWNEPYPTGGSRLRAFIHTVIECVIDGSEPEVVSDLSFEDLIAAIKRHTPKKLGSVHDLSQKDLKLLGFAPVEEARDSALNASTDDNDDGSDDDDSDKTRDDMNKSTHTTIANEVALRLLFIAMEKSLFHTNDGLLGLGPPGMKQGDLVYLVHGSSLPVLLRKTVQGTFNVGSCYVSGISGTEAFSILNIRENDVRKITII